MMLISISIVLIATVVFQSLLGYTTSKDDSLGNLIEAEYKFLGTIDDKAEEWIKRFKRCRCRKGPMECRWSYFKGRVVFHITAPNETYLPYIQQWLGGGEIHKGELLYALAAV